MIHPKQTNKQNIHPGTNWTEKHCHYVNLSLIYFLLKKGV